MPFITRTSLAKCRKAYHQKADHREVKFFGQSKACIPATKVHGLGGWGSRRVEVGLLFVSVEKVTTYVKSQIFLKY